MQTKANQDNTVSDNGQPKGFVADFEHPNKKTRIRKKQAIAALLIVLVIISCWIVYRHYSKPTVAAAEHSEFIKKTQILATGYQFSESEALIKDYLKKRLTTSQKFDALLALGVDYEGQQNWQEALNYFKQAEAISPKPSYSLQIRMASDYLHAGDKDKSITYYEKAIDAAGHDNDPSNDAYITGYQSIVDMLKSGKEIPSNFKSNNSSQAK